MTWRHRGFGHGASWGTDILRCHWARWCRTLDRDFFRNIELDTGRPSVHSWDQGRFTAGTADHARPRDGRRAGTDTGARGLRGHGGDGYAEEAPTGELTVGPGRYR
ncbi:hypothetical protein GCM10023320_29430 [Pseudonocardia adelaidensis]|uniref:Uncharacterized protein n=1 Tax=Pseudonocardia adelaidensis TaxID=648754 RepID=A0ABP9NLN7_9PSEU